MRIKLFGHYWHVGFGLLWLIDSLVTFGTCWGITTLLLQDETPAGSRAVIAVILAGCVIVAMVSMGLFSRRLRDRFNGVVVRLTLGIAAGGTLGWLLLAALPGYHLAVQHALAALAASWFALIVARFFTLRFIDEDLFKRRVLVFGAGVNAARLLQLRRRSDRRGFKLVGFVPAPAEKQEVSGDLLLADGRTLSEIAKTEEIDEIVVAMDDRRQQFPLKELLDCRLAGIEVNELLTFLELETGRVHLDVLNPSWMIFSGGFRRDIMRRFSERLFDLVASFLILLVAAPFMLLTALAIKLEDGWRSPVFYGQPRVGYAARVFKVLKFRSMRVDAEQDGRARWAQANDNRITRVGAFIRKTRIDELPQLINVFRGHMSFVGPRPERPEFVAQLSDTIPYYHERHSVKPGITGWAQLCYPYGASEKDAMEKLQYDLYYVKNHGLIFDILILLQTVEVILLGKGAR